LIHHQPTAPTLYQSDWLAESDLNLHCFWNKQQLTADWPCLIVNHRT